MVDYGDRAITELMLFPLSFVCRIFDSLLLYVVGCFLLHSGMFFVLGPPHVKTPHPPPSQGCAGMFIVSACSNCRMGVSVFLRSLHASTLSHIRMAMNVICTHASSTCQTDRHRSMLICIGSAVQHYIS